MQLEYCITATLASEALDTKRREFESIRFRGLAVRFNSPIETFPTRTLFRKGAFAKTISENANRVKVLFGHNTQKVPIGVPTEMKETDVGLEIAASLNRTEDGQNVSAMLRHLKTLNKLSAAELSIGFDAINFEMFEDPDTREIFRVVTDARLWEISVVAFGADPTTEVREAASLRLVPTGPSWDELRDLAAIHEIAIAEIDYKRREDERLRWEQERLRADADRGVREIREAGVDLFLLANRDARR